MSGAARKSRDKANAFNIVSKYLIYPQLIRRHYFLGCFMESSRCTFTIDLRDREHVLSRLQGHLDYGGSPTGRKSLAHQPDPTLCWPPSEFPW
jgi:hypothetical protein